MKNINSSSKPISETQGDMKLMVHALCYAVSIATDDVHKKYLAELIYRLTNQVAPESSKDISDTSSIASKKKQIFKIK